MSDVFLYACHRVFFCMYVRRKRDTAGQRDRDKRERQKGIVYTSKEPVGPRVE